MKTEYKKAYADDPNIDDSPPALISDNDILKFFNLERDNVQEITFTHKSDGLYVGITLNQKYFQCPVCGNMTKKIKDYKEKRSLIPFCPSPAVISSTRQEDISAFIVKRHSMKIIHLPLEVSSLLLLFPMFSKTLNLQMQLLLMLPKDIIFLQHQLSTSLTDMSIFQEDHYLNVLPLMKSMPLNLMTVTMYV